jgi:hypothetical protein
LAGGLPPLPQDRETSATPILERRGYNTFDHSADAHEEDAYLVLESHLDKLCWGIWHLNPGSTELQSVEVLMDIPPGNDVYIALANYSRGAWEMHGPLSIRVAMTVATTFGAVLMTWHLVASGLVIPCILTVSGFILAVYLTWIVPRAGQTALVTAGSWTLLAGFALLLPMG